MSNDQPQPGDTVRCTVEGPVAQGNRMLLRNGGSVALSAFDTVEVVKRHAPPIPRDVPGTMVMRASGVVWVCRDDLLWETASALTSRNYDDLMTFGDSVEVKRVHP